MEGKIWRLGYLMMVISLTPTSISGCATRYASGWGAPAPVLILPKPTLLPKLRAAFLDGKASVALKGLPLGWTPPHPHPPVISHPSKLHSPLEINGLGYDGYAEDYGYGGVNRAHHVINYNQKHQGDAYNNINYDNIGQFPIPDDFPL